MRTIFSRTVPSLLWNTMPASFSTRSSSFAFLSSSKKNRASDRRARIVVLFPFAIFSGARAVLATVM